MKGKKDTVDIISLLHVGSIDFKKLKNILQDNNLLHLWDHLNSILDSMVELEELDIDTHASAGAWS
jgi:hypothetical protein